MARVARINTHETMCQMRHLCEGSMTDRYNYLTVVLETDMTGGEAGPLISAIRQLRGVVSVTPNVSASEDWWAFERARQELGAKLLKVLYPPKE